jgi:hypothetical protein
VILVARATPLKAGTEDEESSSVGRRGDGGAGVSYVWSGHGAGLSPRPAEAVTPALTVTVSCKATPETTRVKNNRNTAKTIKTVGSIYRPYSEEPLTVNRRLGGGRSITFESGSGADRNVLTGKYIYNNDVGTNEGARATTPSGARFVDRCGS